MAVIIGTVSAALNIMNTGLTREWLLSFFLLLDCGVRCQSLFGKTEISHNFRRPIKADSGFQAQAKIQSKILE